MKFLHNIDVGVGPNFTLPLTDGTSGQVLSTNGAGTVSWTSPTTGTMSVWYALADTHSGTGTGLTVNDTDEIIFEGGTGISTQTELSTGKVIITATGNYAGWDISDGTTTESILSTNGVTFSGAGIATTSYNSTTNTMTITATETYTAHENISAASSVNNSGNDFIQDITLDSNGHVTGLVSATAASGGSGDLVDVDTNASLNVIATYEGTANTIDYAGNGTYNLMSDGAELSLANDTWATRASGGANPKYFLHASPTGTVRSAIYGTGAEVISLKGSADDQWLAVRNANNAVGNIVGMGLRVDNAQGEIQIEGRKGVSANKTFAIESISTSATADRLHVINYGDNHFRLANAVSDQPFMFYWGNGTSWGNVTNEFTTLGVRVDPTSIAVDGTNDASSPNFRFLDDGDTGMFLQALGKIGFSSGAAEKWRMESNGDFHADGDVIAYSTTVSDARLKEDVETIQSASEKVSRLRGVEYTWKKGSRKGQREIGLIAQEVEEVIPEIVREKELPFLGDGLADSSTVYKTVDYEKIVALLIESNKELQARVEELERKIK